MLLHPPKVILFAADAHHRAWGLVCLLKEKRRVGPPLLMVAEGQKWDLLRPSLGSLHQSCYLLARVLEQDRLELVERMLVPEQALH